MLHATGSAGGNSRQIRRVQRETKAQRDYDLAVSIVWAVAGLVAGSASLVWPGALQVAAKVLG